MASHQLAQADQSPHLPHPPGGGANVWSAWETTTFGTASSAPTDRTFSAWTLDGRLLLLDDKLIGQENQT